MANRFLIGTGSRNVSNTAIWSDTSGGTGGFSAPTLGDAVWFDNNSGTGALNLDVATSWGSLDSTGLTGIITITSAVYTLSLYGSWTIHGTYQKFALTGTAYFYQKGTGTITTNGNLFLALNRLYIDGVGITVTNADDYTGGQVYLKNGTWDTNSKNIFISTFLTETGIKTLTLGSSIFNTSQWYNQISLNFTFNYGTSTVISRNSIFQLLGINTFYNLSITGPNRIDAGIQMLSNTILNNLTIQGYNSNSARLLVSSLTIGTPSTITCNGTTNITNCDFQDITLAGTANRDFSAQTDIGNCGGTSGIVFPPAVDCFLKHTSGAMSVSNVAKWVTTDGGSTQARVPLPQDRAWGKASSFTGASTVTMDCPRIGSIDLSEVNQAVIWALGNAISCYGNYVLGSNITPSGGFALNLSGRGLYEFNSYGKTLIDIFFYCYNGSYLNKSNIIITGGLNVGGYGVVDFNDYNVTASFLIRIATIASIINLGNGVITLTRNNFSVLIFDSVHNLNSENSTIILNPQGGSNNISFSANAKALNNVHFSGTHTGNFDIYGNITFNQIKIDAGRKVRFTAGTTQTLLTPLDATGTAANPITISGVTAAEHTLNYTGTSYIQCDYLNLTNSKVLPAGKWFAGKNSVNVSGNVNWLFRRYIMMPIITIIRKL